VGVVWKQVRVRGWVLCVVCVGVDVVLMVSVGLVSVFVSATVYVCGCGCVCTCMCCGRILCVSKKLFVDERETRARQGSASEWTTPRRPWQASSMHLL